jgi:uncharacterized protein YcbK (DUF882 family)
MKFWGTKFGIPALCLAAVSIATAIDFAVHRETGVLAALTTSLGIPWFHAGPSGSKSAPSGEPAANERSRIVVTHLPDVPVTLRLRTVNGSEVGSFAISTDGAVDATSESALEHLLRCRRTGREHVLAAGVLAILVSVAQQWPGRVIDIVSAFRAPPFGVPHSKHFIGHAIDLRVEGVKTSKLRDFIWQNRHEVGVGYYSDEDFVHADSRPGEPDMAWSAGRESDVPNYNPRWAWSARHPPTNHACAIGCT